MMRSGSFNGNRGKAAVGEKFETADFVDNAVLGGAGREASACGASRSACARRLEILDALEHADRYAASRQYRSGEQAGS